MTLHDLLKRVNKEDYDKIIIITDGVGWTNISGKLLITESTIGISTGDNRIFSDD